VTTQELLALIGVGLALLTFGFGVVQFWRAQRWKRIEFLAAAVKEFEASPKVRAVMVMLDYSNREIELFPTATKPEARVVRVTDEMLASALAPHDIKPLSTDNEAQIRDCFDEFLGYFERFNSHIEAGLVPAGAFKPYLNYWVKAVAGKTKVAKPAVVQQLGREVRAVLTDYGPKLGVEPHGGELRPVLERGEHLAAELAGKINEAFGPVVEPEADDLVSFVARFNNVENHRITPAIRCRPAVRAVGRAPGKNLLTTGTSLL